MIGWVVFLVVVVGFLAWRRRVKNRRAGLQATAPLFHVEPPGGRLRAKSRETL